MTKSRTADRIHSADFAPLSDPFEPKFTITRFGLSGANRRGTHCGSARLGILVSAICFRALAHYLLAHFDHGLELSSPVATNPPLPTARITFLLVQNYALHIAVGALLVGTPVIYSYCNLLAGKKRRGHSRQDILVGVREFENH